MLSFISVILVMVSLHSDKIVSKSEVDTRDWGIIEQAGCWRNRKTLGLQTRKVVGRFEWT